MYRIHTMLYTRCYLMMIQEEYMISMARKDYRSKAHTAMEMCSPGTINVTVFMKTGIVHTSTLRIHKIC